MTDITREREVLIKEVNSGDVIYVNIERFQEEINIEICERFNVLDDDLEDADYKIVGHKNIKSVPIDILNKINISDLEELNLFLEETDESDELIKAAFNHLGTSDLDDVKEMIECLSCYDSWVEYAESLYNECYEIPEHLENYIDYDAIARDLEIEAEYIEADYKIYIINN